MKKFRGLGILIFLAVFSAITAIVMLLWNSVATDLFGVPEVNFWYAAGLIILSKLLLGGFRNAHDFYHTHRRHLSRKGEHWQNGWEECCDKDKRKQMHERFHSMSHAERKEHIRRHMASAFHEGECAGTESIKEEGEVGNSNG